ncbi:transposase [Streptomyces sp. NPDC015032]|uniref:transposase n=1 Tax=Streptomyces sp. NPDC015032 TaxID=3364937 RepID=UPI0036F95AE4
MGSKKKPPYDAEFREGAVRIVIETGRSAGDVAEELGINPGTLHSWVSRWRRNGTTSSDRPVQPTAVGFPTQRGRTSAIRHLVLLAPAPVVARMLGYHDDTTAQLAAEAGGTWRHYAPSDHTR